MQKRKRERKRRIYWDRKRDRERERERETERQIIKLYNIILLQKYYIHKKQYNTLDITLDIRDYEENREKRMRV